MVQNIKRLSKTRLFPIAILAALLAMPGIARAEVEHNFLVARPTLDDPLFGQSVVLMLPPPANPLIAGVIINKPTAIPVKQVFPRSVDLKDPSDVVYFGGPVEPEATLMVRRTTAPTESERHVFGDLYVSVDPKVIATILKDPNLDRSNIRVFLGYSQWDQDQLGAEKMEGSWYEIPADEDEVFTSKPKQLWQELANHARYLRVNLAPFDPASTLTLPPPWLPPSN